MTDLERRLRHLYDQVQALPPERRLPEVDRLTDDPVLRRRLAALLAAEEHAQDFMNDQWALAGSTDALRQVLSSKDPTAAGPPEQIDRYRLLERLGEGGFGVVYLAEQIEPVRRRVAVKVIKPGMDSRAVIARFEQERQALAVMSHPNIAKVLDAGVTDRGAPFFVMELVAGEPITTYCDRQNLSLRDRLKLFIPVCEAVQHAHHKGIIHRDIKPSNILVAVHDAAPVPKVIDFGVAKATAGPLTDRTVFTEIGQLIGTPEYMSPEQAEMGAMDIDTRTDVYSLGAVLYELLAGAVPFDAKSLRAAAALEIQRIIREVEPPKPSTRLSSLGADQAGAIARRRRLERESLASELRRELDWIPLKAIRKDRTERYQTATALADDIRNYLAGAPLDAGPERALYRLRKLVKRNRLPVAAGLAVALSLVLVIGVLAVWGHSAQAAARRNAELAADNAELATTNADLAADNAEQAREAQSRAADLEVALAAEASARVEASRSAYFAHIQAAHACLGAADGPGARRHLDQCDPEHRGWEWRYLDAASDQSIATFRASAQWVSSADVSPDGRHVVTGDGNGQVNIWSVESGAIMASLSAEDADVDEGFAGPAVIFGRDGHTVLTGGSLGTVRRWEVPSGELVQTLSGPNATVEQLAEGRNGEVISGGFSGLRLWRPGEDGLTPMTFGAQTAGRTQGVRARSFGVLSDSGELLATWDLVRNEAVLWRGPTEWRAVPLRGHEAPVRAVAISHDDEFAATAGEDGRVLVSRAASGELARAFELGDRLSDKRLVGIEFTSEDGVLVSTSFDGRVHLLDMNSQRDPVELGRLSGSVWSSVMSPDRTTLVTGTQNGAIARWDLGTRGDPQTLLGHEAGLSSVSFSSDGRLMVSAGTDGTARLWETATPTNPRGVSAHTDYVHELALDPGGRLCASVSSDGTLSVLHTRTGEIAWSANAHDGWASCVAWSSDGSMIATGGSDGRLRVWSARTGAAISTYQRPEAGVLDVAFFPDNDRLISGWSDGAVGITRAQTGEDTGCGFTLGEDAWNVVVSPSGRFALAAGSDGAMVWNCQQCRQQANLEAWAFGPDLAAMDGSEALIAVAQADDAVLISDPQTGNVVRRFEPAHEASNPADHQVESVAISPDGSMLAVAYYSGIAQTWDLGTGELLGTMRGHLGICDQVVFLDGGARVLTACEDGTVALWETRTGQQILVLHRGSASTRVAVDQRSEIVAVGDGDGNVTIYDSVPWRVRSKLLDEPPR